MGRVGEGIVLGEVMVADATTVLAMLRRFQKLTAIAYRPKSKLLTRPREYHGEANILEHR